MLFGVNQERPRRLDRLPGNNEWKNTLSRSPGSWSGDARTLDQSEGSDRASSRRKETPTTSCGCCSPRQSTRRPHVRQLGIGFTQRMRSLDLEKLYEETKECRMKVIPVQVRSDEEAADSATRDERSTHKRRSASLSRLRWTVADCGFRSGGPLVGIDPHMFSEKIRRDLRKSRKVSYGSPTMCHPKMSRELTRYHILHLGPSTCFL